jgi:predicted acyl esterase
MRRLVLTATLILSLTVADGAQAAPVARGSVEQVQVTKAEPGARVVLLRAGRVAGAKRAGPLGGVVFRRVTPARGYRVRSGGVTTKRLRVLADRAAPPSVRRYRQRIPRSGYGYLTTRDGTKLAINVRLPAGPPPYPTVVEYAGYGYANPSGGESSIAQLLNLLGYAVVDVNMRGTGCSGGAFDYFEPLQGLDGYDVVETVARQPWVLHGKVGMAGLSYGGISQLFVAERRPPSLAAIAPLSVIDATATTLYPGGVLNTGFALSWAKDRVYDARPASPRGGQAWALERIRGGDRTCKANQVLHPEAVDLLAKIERNRYYVPQVADPLAPVTFADRITVPTFLACQWTDEQTGGHCPALASAFDNDRAWFTFTNGTHIDAMAPATFQRWFDFLELYVARRAPRLPAGTEALAPVIYKTIFGIDGVTLPPDPIQAEPTFEAARAAFERQPRVRILFDNGGVTAGAPVPAFEQSFARFPLPGTQARLWYLGPDGTMADAPPASGTDDFVADRAARPATSFRGDTGAGTNGLWTATPSYDWTQNPPGSALSYLTEPLAADTAIVGAGALRAWIRSAAPDVDLQLTITEVRPDGKETFVQNGWLRASARKLEPGKGTLFEPVPSLRRRDARPLRKGRFERVDVPLYYQGHVYRAGSRLRLIVSAAGGDQPVWAFGRAAPRRAARVELARGAGHPSRLLLPVVPGVAAPTPLPPCPGLRGQPCRAYVPLAN